MEFLKLRKHFGGYMLLVKTALVLLCPSLTNGRSPYDPQYLSETSSPWCVLGPAVLLPTPMIVLASTEKNVSEAEFSF